jgi:hypothetical protein
LATEIRMTCPGRTTAAASTPVGITAVLALLWLLAAASAGPGSQAALALDPGRPGSIGEWWGGAQLWLALGATLATPATRSLVWAPAALLAGEQGELHIHLARLLADAAGVAAFVPPLKSCGALLLGMVALTAMVRFRHEVCCIDAVMVMIAAGVVAIGIDALAPVEGMGVWLTAVEEWSELGACSVVAAACWNVGRPSWFGTIFVPASS